MNADAIELIRLKGVDYSATQSAKHPPESSRELVQAALMCAYLEGAQEALRTIKAELRK